MGELALRLVRHCILAVAVALMFTVSVNAAPQAPLIYGAWNVQCKPRTGSTENLCVANQLITAGKSKEHAIFGVMVAQNREHKLPHIIFRMGPTANIQKGAAVKVDDHKPFRVAISKCDEQTCEVRSLIPEPLLSQMRSGKLLKFAFFVDNKQVTYPVYLEGFDKTYTALSTESR
ncbi:MAG: invasion associated locus B family protein [Motiliproteus sp.]|nr:invasion associated locus B family protein [Motiliproteus sp.]MCW9051184.1 invasion associated locus B family protein [Motiliproteus sp.]